MSMSRRTVVALLVAAGVTAAAAGVIWLIHVSSNPVDTATVYGADLAAAALAVTILIL
jgi:ABC-type sugar transport system substrate-binding protein